ncbi:MAG: hypothetical protein IJK43_05655 [Prevotella sp.]|nr:hypothetical protein [Prevotella sp.]
MKLIAVRRDDRFSPNSVEKDRLILEAACNNVCRHFEQQGEPCALRWVDEAELTTHDDADLYLSMARLPEALSILEGFEQQGRRIINTPQGVRNCQRVFLEKIMRNAHIAMPPAYNGEGLAWLKRGDAAAQSKDDVCFCKDAESLNEAIARFKARGISDYVVSPHVEGDVVKFYGVSDLHSTEEPGSDPLPFRDGLGIGFFRYYYPTDDGLTKFGDETARNGEAHHYAFDVSALQSEVERLARLVGIEVYGGDAIIDRDGHFYIIDFNDWPSFSRCRDEAAEAIGNCPLK